MNLQRHGLRVTAQPGWDIRIYRRAAAEGETTNPVLHAATVRLPWVRGDYGSNVVDRLGRRDAFFALIEFDPEAASTALFGPTGIPRPRSADFSPLQLHRVLPRQSGAQWFFNARGRAFSLYVVIGDHAQRLFVLPRVRQIIETVGVGEER